MRKSRCRHLAALAAAAVAAALLLPQVASAKPDAPTSPAARPAATATAAASGASQGTALAKQATLTRPSPDLPCAPPRCCPTIAPSGHQSGSQSAPQSCPGPPPPPPQFTCTLTPGVPRPVGPFLHAPGSISCSAPRRISLLVTIDKQVGPGWTEVAREPASCQSCTYLSTTAETDCEEGTYRSQVQATLNTGEYFSKKSIETDIYPQEC